MPNSSKFDERIRQAMIAPHVSPTDEKGPGAWPAEGGLAGEPVPESGADRVSSVEPLRPRSQPPEACPFVYDEAQRTRLMADIMRLLREPSIPRSARLAGLTLVGWLARRRPAEAPHAIGIDEARESERRIQSARAKIR
jgi:hypothetical protein